MCAARDDSNLPKRIGLIGVGTIGCACIRGLCKPGPGAPQEVPQIVVGPRNAEKAAALASEYPDHIRVAGSNQEVVDSVDCVIVAVLGKQAEEVLGEIQMRSGQQLLSIMAGFKLERLKELFGSEIDIATGIPLPAVQRREGATLLTPARPFAKAIFDILGTCVAVDDDAQFKRMLCVSCIMGDFYKRQLTVQNWLVQGGVGEEEARSWTGATFKTFAADSHCPGAKTFHELVEEQTPGGLNELGWKQQLEDGSYESLQHSMTAIHHRVINGSEDPDLAPAVKRARK
eukprot:TRINITY_DN113659_c0_g1_i1.p1 TRINITY_DN113659_c0_g1~~TRINITY_DN113659_c0_g1_i1.p1  ORF type:complete len:287 (+),score=53.64 TRINITY_DN113659_c0_g1_i1:58-918(+)